VVAECKSPHEEYGYTLWVYHCVLLALAVALATKGWYLTDSAQESKPLAVSAHVFTYTVPLLLLLLLLVLLQRLLDC
jgi:heme O synthase-like polyprenyltransferase